ncbi:hypothetical protein Ddc_01173 [Ditylenchus destructor]|nr:hypothetical protein Ddc_01173 [Ditylenchus destructor]
MLAELAAFSRGSSPVVSSAQYRSYIMPKIFGESTACENTATDASQMAYSKVAPNCAPQVANYYNSAHQVTSVPSSYPYGQQPASSVPIQNPQTLQGSQTSLSGYNVQYRHTNTAPNSVPTQIQPSQPFGHHYHSRTISQPNHLPSYLEAVPLPKFQPASLSPIPPNRPAASVVSYNGKNHQNKVKSDIGQRQIENQPWMSPFATFLTTDQQIALHELIVEARGAGAKEDQVQALSDEYVRTMLSPDTYVQFQEACQAFNQHRAKLINNHQIHQDEPSRILNTDHQWRQAQTAPKNAPKRIQIANSRDLYDFLNKPDKERNAKELERMP